MDSLEIDFFPVGTGSKSGDAITFRIGDYQQEKWSNQKVFVIDGGTKETGIEIVRHVQNVYNTNEVERVILTHPDGDHASGLREVLNGLKVNNIWMHRPWNHSDELKNIVNDKRTTLNSLENKLRDAYSYANAIEQIANAKKMPIFNSHQGSFYSINNERILTILGPSRSFYLEQIKLSTKTPEMSYITETRSFSKGKMVVDDDPSFDDVHLENIHCKTSAENNMSLILLLEVAGAKVLFTGDAGTQALMHSIEFATKCNISLKDLNLFQVPHHGSRHNISKEVLNHISANYAIISCAQASADHPSPVVINALYRRQINAYHTKGMILTYNHGNVPIRPYLSQANPINFVSKFELSY